MKTFLRHPNILLVLILIIFSSVLFAQNSKTTLIHLKNGYTIKGEIIEQTEQSILIRTIDGETIRYSMSEVSDT
jgi:hypothetical protein